MSLGLSSSLCRRSSSISLYVAHDSSKKAPMMSRPPTMAALVRGELRGGGSSWSTRATMKMVSRAATEESTGLVREMRTRKEPENAGERLVLGLLVGYFEGVVRMCSRQRAKREESRRTRVGQHANGHHPGLLAAGQR